MSVPRLVDTHAHVMDSAFDADRDAVLLRALESGVGALVLVGYDLATSRGAVELAARIPNAVATVGIHPNAAGAASQADFDAIERLARNNPHVVGIGETGLDYYRHHTPPARQREAFAWHLELAETLDKPVIVHNRQADTDVAEVARAHRRAGVLHCFSSSDEQYLRSMLDAGFFVSFAGPLTFRNAAATRRMAALVPLDRLLVETDCPYLAPEPHRGRRNEPAYVRETAACLAEVRSQSLEQLAEQLWSNCMRVFPALAELSTEAAA